MNALEYCEQVFPDGIHERKTAFDELKMSMVNCGNDVANDRKARVGRTLARSRPCRYDVGGKMAITSFAQD